MFLLDYQANLASNEGQNDLVSPTFSILIELMKKNTGTTFITHLFSTLQSLVNKFPMTLYGTDTTFCADLCVQVGINPFTHAANPFTYSVNPFTHAAN